MSVVKPLPRQRVLKNCEGPYAVTLEHYTDNDIQIGDLVYFKRKDSDRYRGTAKVIGKDGKNVILKYGGLVNTVHLCRVVKVEDANQLLCEDEDADSSDDESSSEVQNENAVSIDIPCSEMVADIPDATVEDVVSPDVISQSVTETLGAVSAPSDEVSADSGNVSQQRTDQGTDKMTGGTLPKKNTKVKFKLPNESDWKVVDVIDKHKPT